GLAASYIGPKDFVHGMMNAAEPTAGLIGTWFKNGTKFARDIARGTGAWDRQHAGKTIADTATLVGMLTGLSTAQLGRSAQFVQRWNAGLEHPKSGMEWLQGLRKGTIKERRR